MILEPVRQWVCPNCTQTDVTRDHRPHTRMHDCAGMAGMSMPFVIDGEKCSVVVTEREDYIGTELVQTDDNGRPIMNTRIIRDDGEDCFVYAATATAKS